MNRLSFQSFAVSLSVSVSALLPYDFCFAETQDLEKKREVQAESFFQEVLHRDPHPDEVMQTVLYLETKGLPSSNPKVQKKQIKDFFETVLDRDPSSTELDQTSKFLGRQMAEDKKAAPQNSDPGRGAGGLNEGTGAGSGSDFGPRLSYGGSRRGQSDPPEYESPNIGIAVTPPSGGESVVSASDSVADHQDDQDITASAIDSATMPVASSAAGNASSEGAMATNLPLARRELADQVQQGKITAEMADTILQKITPALGRLSDLDTTDANIRALVASPTSLSVVATTPGPAAPPATPAPGSVGAGNSNSAPNRTANFPSAFSMALLPARVVLPLTNDSKTSAPEDKQTLTSNKLRPKNKSDTGIAGESAITRTSPENTDRAYDLKKAFAPLVSNSAAKPGLTAAEKIRTFIGKVITAMTDNTSVAKTRAVVERDRKPATTKTSALEIPTLEKASLRLGWPTRATSGDGELSEDKVDAATEWLDWETVSWTLASGILLLLGRLALLWKRKIASERYR